MADLLYAVVNLAAEALIAVALAVWMAPVLQILGWVDLSDARVNVIWRCSAIGSGYGAACGSLYGVVLSFPSRQGIPWDTIFWGAVGGGLLGAFGGGATGFFGTIRRPHVGWWLAGAMGSAASAACVWIISAFAAAFAEEIGRREMLSGALAACAVIIVIGGFLGAELDATLRSGRSIVPGVQGLAAMINDANRPERGS